MIDDQDDNPARTVEDILAEWKAEGPAIAAEMERRRQQIERDETLAWAKQRAEAREIPETVTKSYEAPTNPASVSAPAPDWSAYIRRELAKRDRVSDRVMAKGIAQVLLAEEKTRASEIASLRTTIDELRERIDRLEVSRGNASLRAV
jgi:hypothetical protein